ncbi:MAG: hypothetical protein U1E61_11045 [Bradyrhizobium sp.]
MKNAFMLFALTVLSVTFAQAQGTKYYVDWDYAAKKCVVVDKRPTNPNLADLPPYNSKAEAEAAFKVLKGCSPESMKQ